MTKLDWIDLAKRPADFEGKCAGRNGQAWAYTVTHSQLLIRFYDDESASKHGVYLCCKDTRSVTFKKHWESARPQVQLSEDDKGKRVITIVDGDNLTAECGYAFWVEHEGMLDSDKAFF